MRIIINPIFGIRVFAKTLLMATLFCAGLVGCAGSSDEDSIGGSDTRHTEAGEDSMAIQEEPVKRGDRLLADLTFGDSALYRCIAASGALRVSELTELSCDGENEINKITSISGIKQLNSLKSLKLSHTHLLEFIFDKHAVADIELTHNSKLKLIHVWGAHNLNRFHLSDNPSLASVNILRTALKRMDLSDLSGLKSAYFSNNREFTEINVSGSEALERLQVFGSGDRVEPLDLSSNANLRILKIQNWGFDAIDLSANTQLTELQLHNNQLTRIDLSANTALNTLDLALNPIVCTDIEAINLQFPVLMFNFPECVAVNRSTQNPKAAILLSKVHFEDPALESCVRASGKETVADVTELYCRRTSSNWGVSSVLGLEQLVALKTLVISSEGVDTIDLSANLALTSVDIRGGGLASVNLSENILLTSLSLEVVGELDCEIFMPLAENLAKIEFLGYQGSVLPDKDFTGYSALEILRLSNTKMSSVDLSQNKALTWVSLKGPISGVDLSGNTVLARAYISSNELRTLQLPEGNTLKRLNLDGGAFSHLDFSSAAGLTFLSIDTVNVKALDLSNNAELQFLNIYDLPQLASIDLSGNTNLRYVYLYQTAISVVNFSGYSALAVLHVYAMPLKALSLPTQSNLYELELFSTLLTDLDLSYSANLRHLVVGSTPLSALNLTGNNNLEYVLFDEGVSGCSSVPKTKGLYCP